jgi:dihydrofolate reductase
MRKLILEEWLSLDGFTADKEGDLDFFTNSDTSYSNKYADQDQLEFLETIDTILLGRITYELFVDFWPTATTDKEIIADRLNEIPKVIFSNSLTKAPWGKWPAAKIISGEAVTAIKKLKEGPGKNIVLWGSITLAQSLMEAGLVDEYHLRICPVILGGGKSLFPSMAEKISLKLISTKQYAGGILLLHYQPAK